MKDIGIKLEIPSDALMKKVAKEKQFEYKGKIFKEGSIITLRLFNKKFNVKLFFDENKKMLMYKDPINNASFNILGYMSNAQI